MKEVSVEQLLPADWLTYREIQLEALKEEPHAFGANYKEWFAYKGQITQIPYFSLQEKIHLWQVWLDFMCKKSKVKK